MDTTMNQNNPMNGMNNMPGMGGMTPKKKSAGPLIAVIVILLLIIIGGLYFLGQRINNSSYSYTSTGNAGQTDSITASLNQQSTSDDLSSIEKDLNNTNVDNLDQGAAAIEAEAQSK